MQANPIPQNLQELQQKVAFVENVKRITEQIHAARDRKTRRSSDLLPVDGQEPMSCRPIPSHRTFRNFSKKWHLSRTSSASRNKFTQPAILTIFSSICVKRFSASLMLKT